MKRTRNPKIWLQYLCWQVQFWMMTHRPHIVPSVLHRPITRLWMRTWPAGQKPSKHPAWLDWMWTTRLPGWSELERLFRRGTGGRSHRCEFTDPHQGALYGHNEGAFMDRYFDKLLGNIEGEDLG